MPRRSAKRTSRAWAAVFRTRKAEVVSPAMKLYHQPRTRSSRVRWLLAELGVPCEIQVVDVFTGAGRTPEYQQLHPHGFVPAFEDDGVVLIESSAICMYLADRYGEGRLA